MEGDHIKTYPLLQPLAWLYGLGVGLRNLLFDCGILSSRSFDVPVISVGNISVGGAGKTPHTEYLIRLLQDRYHVAILSRGYKRRSRGYILADTDTPMPVIGDEPHQMKQKYPHAHVAVDKNRCRGIQHLISSETQPPADVILLDDAFQHRYVQPGINILIMDYHRLICFDRLLPAGRLREPKSALHRADIVIVSKCPSYLTPMDKRGIERSLDMQPWQHIFFTTLTYDTPYPLITPPADVPVTPPAFWQTGADTHRTLPMLLLTGIASPQQMEYDLSRLLNADFDVLSFPDHHAYTTADITTIIDRSHGKTIITTEKDAARLRSLPPSMLPPSLAASIWVLPIKVSFLDADRQQLFDNLIQSYVHKNSRSSILNK